MTSRQTAQTSGGTATPGHYAVGCIAGITSGSRSSLKEDEPQITQIDTDEARATSARQRQISNDCLLAQAIATGTLPSVLIRVICGSNSSARPPAATVPESRPRVTRPSAADAPSELPVFAKRQSVFPDVVVPRLDCILEEPAGDILVLCGSNFTNERFSHCLRQHDTRLQRGNRAFCILRSKAGSGARAPSVL